MRAAAATALLLLALASISAAPRFSDRALHDRARLLDRWARESVDDPNASIEERQRAERDIEEALKLEPDVADHWLVLGRLREIQRLDERSRDCFERAIRLAPADPEPRRRLAMAWKREWLRTLDAAAHAEAIAQLDTITRLRPTGTDAWLALVPLLYERGDLASAAEAARRALSGRPRRVEAPLAAAYLAWRGGEIERADSLFRATIPRLADDLRAMFEHPERVLAPAPVGGWDSAGGAATAPAGDRGASLLDRLDPDPTTAANEIQLECWSRIAHAYFVFYDPRSPGLDARAETYMRYGPPRGVQRNPPGIPLYFKPNVVSTGRAASMAEYPLDAQVWDYPELGLRVLLHDRSLLGHYTQPVARDFDPGSVPNPRILAAHGDLVALDGGFAVLPTLPPRDQRLEVRGAIARFEGERGPRLLAQARVPGAPADTLTARWVALDSSGHEVARGAAALDLSACDPAERRLAEFSADLPPGAFDLTISIRDSHRRRGIFRQQITVAPPEAALDLSDLVLCCGNPTLLAAEGTVRIEENMGAPVTGREPLTTYFEIYRLRPGDDGLSHFRYEYEVKRWTDSRDVKALRVAASRPPVSTWASREEAHAGTMRRQFMTVQTSALVPGRYRIELRVTDLVSGASVSRAVEFVRE